MFGWLKSAPVPEIAACELECGQRNCRQDEFDRCELRLRVAQYLTEREAAKGKG